MRYHLTTPNAIWAKTTPPQTYRLTSWGMPNAAMFAPDSKAAMWRSCTCLRRSTWGEFGNHIELAFSLRYHVPVGQARLSSPLLSSRYLYFSLSPRSWDTSVLLKLSLPRDKGLDPLCNSLNSALNLRGPRPQFFSLYAPVTCCNFQRVIWLPGIHWGGRGREGEKKKKRAVHGTYASVLHTHIPAKRNSNVYLWITVLTKRSVCPARWSDGSSENKIEGEQQNPSIMRDERYARETRIRTSL